MSLVSHLPSDRKALSGQTVFNIFWMTGAGFAVGLMVLLLLQRLGLPLPYVLSTSSIWFAAGFIGLSIAGRTMASIPYFFADKIAGSSSIGLSGTTDWLSASVLMVFLSTSLLGKMVLAPALMFGLLLQAVLFATAFQRAETVTIPGFLAQRGNARRLGVASLMVVVAVVVLLIAAEFQIALRSVVLITRLDVDVAMAGLLILAALPGIAGGWLSLLLVNGVFVLWMFMSLLIPALVVGFVPGFLRSSLVLERSLENLPAISGFENAIPHLADGASAPVILLTLIVMACGFSVLPHSLSRLALNTKAVSSLEQLGWTALFTFLIFSALPLSLGLVFVQSDAAATPLSQALQTNPVLNTLPHFALLLAAFNGLSVLMFAVSSAVVRAFRRTRRKDPGEQSMFPTRLLIVLIVAAVWFGPLELLPSPGFLLVSALSLGAAGLFAPLTAQIWFPDIPRWSVLSAMLAGPAVAVAGYGWIGLNPIEGGGLGMLMGVLILLTGGVWKTVRRSAYSE